MHAASSITMKSLITKILADIRSMGHKLLCCGKGQTIPKTNFGFLNSSNKRTKLTILNDDAQDSEFRSLFGRIEDTINCFRDLLTFTLNLF